MNAKVEAVTAEDREVESYQATGVVNNTHLQVLQTRIQDVTKAEVYVHEQSLVYSKIYDEKD